MLKIKIIKIKNIFFKQIKYFLKGYFIKNIKGIFIGILVSLLVSVIYFKNIPDVFIDSRTISGITTNFINKYDYKVLTMPIKPEINPSIIIWGNDKKTKSYCEKLNLDSKLNTPFLRIYKKNDFSILSIIPFFKNSYSLYSQFNLKLVDETDTYRTFYWIHDVKIEDLNGDGKDEIIVRAYSSSCASGGIQYNYVLNENGHELDITTTFPNVSFSKENNKTYAITSEDNAFKNTKQAVYSTNLDSYVNYKDLDNDGYKELIIGYPDVKDEKWGKDGTCHSCPHTWLIGIYKFNGKDWIVDNNWSYGNLYVTKSKIGLYDALGYPALSNNPFNVFFIYYFDCDECDTFRNSSRRKSALLTIVEKNYGKFKTRDELDNE